MICLRNHTRNDIRKAVRNIVKKYDTANPYELCKQMDIPLFFKEIESFVLGFQMSVRRIPTITLNLKNDEYTNNYTLCHELGHHVLGHKVNINDMSNIFSKKYIAEGVEYEANCFIKNRQEVSHFYKW